jgi:3-hydroxyisobutyrate dehydrogenase-like beta-hydroxyacid dehydrogenase
MADAGQLICVPAGPAAAVAKVKPFLKGVVGKAVIDLSDKEPGKATTLKIVGNTFIMNMVEMISEGFTLAETTGVGVDTAQEFVEAIFGGPFAAYGKRMVSGDYYMREEVCCIKCRFQRILTKI